MTQDEIIILQERNEAPVKIKKITTDDGEIVVWQCLDNTDRKWKVIKYETILKYYKMHFVQKRKVLIEKQI